VHDVFGHAGTGRNFDAHLVNRLETEVEQKEVQAAENRGDHVQLELRGETLEARCVVAADGATSTVRRSLDLAYPETAAAYQHHVTLPEKTIDERIGSWFHVHYTFTLGYGWVSPLRGALKVGLGGTGDELDRNSLNDFLETLRTGPLEGAEVEREEAHAIPMAGPIDSPAKGRTLLTGDAGGFVYPGTGEGIYYGIRSGRAAAETVANLVEGKIRDALKTYEEKLREKGLPSLREVDFLEKNLSSEDAAETYVKKLANLLA